MADRIKQLQNLLASKDVELKDANEIIEVQKVQINLLKSSLKEKDEKKDNKERDHHYLNGASKKEYKSLVEENSRLKAQIESLQKDNAHLLKKYKHELHAIKAEIAKREGELQKEMVILGEKLVKLSNKERIEVDLKKSYDEEITKIKEERAQILNKLKECDLVVLDRDILNKQVMAYAKENKELKESNTQLMQKQESFENAINSMKTSIEELTYKLDSAEDKTKNLKNGKNTLEYWDENLQNNALSPTKRHSGSDAVVYKNRAQRKSIWWKK